MGRRDRWMAVGAFVLLVVSFRPWFHARAFDGIDGRTLASWTENAWSGPPFSAAAVVAGIAASLLWFGALRGLTDRARRLVATGLLLGAVALVGFEWRGAEGRTFTFVTIEMGDNLAPPPPIGSKVGEFSAEHRPAHHLALVTLVGMLLIAGTSCVTELRSGGGRRPAGG